MRLPPRRKFFHYTIPVVVLFVIGSGTCRPVWAQGEAGDYEPLWIDDPHWLRNLSFQAALEGSKQPQDFGVNANFGGRAAVNWGLPIWREAGLGLQIGTSINATSNAVQVFERVEGSTGRTQNFTTVGLFQRFDSGFVWGAGYDFLLQDSYDWFALGQFRGRVGYFVNPWNEIGFQGSLRSQGDDGRFLTIPVRLQPITQASAYYHHTFATGVTFGGWAGIAAPHSEANVALGDLPRTKNTFVFGSDLYAPLNDFLAVVGEANFILPADTGTVDSYLGIELRPWGGALAGRRNRYAPMMPVAGSTSMSVDLRR
jgi:hypothetical protein